MNTCLLHNAPRPVRKQRKQRSSFEPEKMPPMDLCFPCGKQSFTTVCGICLKCASEATAKARESAGEYL